MTAPKTPTMQDPAITPAIPASSPAPNGQRLRDIRAQLEAAARAEAEKRADDCRRAVQEAVEKYHCAVMARPRIADDGRLVADIVFVAMDIEETGDEA